MAWKNGYYYRSIWRDGTCHTEYVGAGATAELLAQLDAIEQQKRQEERQAFRRLIAKERAIDETVDAVGAALAALVDGAMLVNGYRQHKRQWRKKRDNQIANAYRGERATGTDKESG